MRDAGVGKAATLESYGGGKSTSVVFLGRKYISWFMDLLEIS